MYKNVPDQKVFIAAISISDGSPKTEGVEFYIAKDTGAQTPAAGEVVHGGNGHWRITFTQEETNTNVLSLLWTGPDVVTNCITLYPVAKKVQDYQTELASINTIAGKLPTYGIADQSTLTGVGYQLNLHCSTYTEERAAKLDNLDANVTSRLAASAAPAHFGDLAITETTGKVTVNNVDECKADVSNVTVGTNLDKDGYGLSTSERSSIAAAVWNATTRTLTSFGAMVSQVVSGVWSAAARTLTAGTRDSAIDAIVAKLPDSNIADQTTALAIKSKTDKLDFSGDGGMLKSESTNMRGTDGAYTGTPPSVAEIVAGVEDEQGKLHETLVRAENTDELLRELTEDDGTGNQRLTAKALEQAPTGESVWSSEQRDAVLEMASTRLVTQSRINTTTTPWRLELLVDQTIVKAYECYDINGAPITSTDAIIAKYVEVV